MISRRMFDHSTGQKFRSNCLSSWSRLARRGWRGPHVGGGPLTPRRLRRLRRACRSCVPAPRPPPPCWAGFATPPAAAHKPPCRAAARRQRPRRRGTRERRGGLINLTTPPPLRRTRQGRGVLSISPRGCGGRRRSEGKDSRRLGHAAPLRQTARRRSRAPLADGRGVRPRRGRRASHLSRHAPRGARPGAGSGGAAPGRCARPATAGCASDGRGKLAGTGVGELRRGGVARAGVERGLGLRPTPRLGSRGMQWHLLHETQRNSSDSLLLHY